MVRCVLDRMSRALERFCFKRFPRSRDNAGRDDSIWPHGGLFAYKDPLSYRHVCPHELVKSRGDVIWLERPTRPYLAVSGYHSFLDQNPDPIFGGNLGELPDLRGPTYVMARSDVALSGYRAFIGRDGCYNLDEGFTSEAIADFVTGRLGQPEVHRNEMIGFRDTPDPALFRMDATGKKRVKMSGPVICMGSNEAPNYGSFLVRMLPKVIQIARLDPSVRILVPMYFSSLKDFLVLAGVDEARLVPQYLDHIYDIERALVPSMRNRDFWLDQETLRFYDGLRERYGAKPPTRRIYVSRRRFKGSFPADQRIMTNEADLIAELEGSGFETIEPETLSAVEQIAVFSSAAVVVGAGGSALFNVVFCHPGTKLIDIEAEPHWIENHVRLFKSRGLDFGILEGTPFSRDFSRPHVPFEVDIPRMRRRLAQLLAPSRSGIMPAVCTD